MHRRIRLAVAALAFAASAVPSAAATNWTFVSQNNSTPSARCAGGLFCSRDGQARDWLVPTSGNYRITLAGAEGGAGWETQGSVDTRVAGGAGAVMSGIYSLSAGTQLVIIAGQAGSSALPASLYGGFGTAGALAGGSGGGGSFVFSVPQLTLLDYGSLRSFDLSASTFLGAAGGGGGTTSLGVAAGTTPGSLFEFLGIDPGGSGLAGHDGGMTWRMVNGVREANSFVGGVNGDQAGRTWNPYDNVPGEYGDPCSNSGASYRVTAFNLCGSSSIAQSIDVGFQGGFFRPGTLGGYGGGGTGTLTPGTSYATFNSTGGGGGGGYSGGGGGTGQNTAFDGSGGGGGSYISEDTIFLSGLSGANRGNGYVTIELLSGVPEPANWAMLVIGFGMVGAVARSRKAVVTV